jgi:MinD-like ATPase involved in chromosome partitioning or flagellar assembly
MTGAGRLRRRDVYARAIVDGQVRNESPLVRLGAGLRELFTSPGTRAEAELEADLGREPALTRSNTIAVVSPKGGVGKTTTTFVIGNLLADRLRLKVLAVDASPDFGTLAALAPEQRRSASSLAALLDEMPRLSCAAEVRRFVSRLPSGLQLLGAPADAETMQEMTPRLYGELLAFLGQYYEVILLDLGTGITDPLAQFALQRADQLVLVTTQEWVTATTVEGAIRYIEPTRATLVLNQARGGDAGDSRAVAQQFAERSLPLTITVPFDERLRMMLDTGTYTLEALDRGTRLPLKELGVAIATRLV